MSDYAIKIHLNRERRGGGRWKEEKASERRGKEKRKVRTHKKTKSMRRRDIHYTIQSQAQKNKKFLFFSFFSKVPVVSVSSSPESKEC